MSNFDSIASVFERAGIRSWELIAKPASELAQKVDRSVNEINRYREDHLACISQPLVSKANEIQFDLISTGIAELDKTLGGGLPTGTVTEVSGSAGVGKTCLCCQIAAANPASTMYLTSEDRAKIVRRRLNDVSRGKDELSAEQFVRITDFTNLRVTLATLKKRLSGLKVIIIDSIGALWSHLGDGEAHNELEELQLRRFAHELNAVIVVVNHVSETKRPQIFGLSQNQLDSNNTYQEADETTGFGMNQVPTYHYRTQSFFVEGDSAPQGKFQVRSKHSMVMADFIDTRLILSRDYQDVRHAQIVFSKLALPSSLPLNMGSTGLSARSEMTQ